MRMTQAEVDAHNLRVCPPNQIPVSAEACSDESELHSEIARECRRRSWYYVHSRMDAPTTTRLGVTDFIIAVGGGRTLWIEAKAKGKKMTTEQLGTQLWLKRDGHCAVTVYSFEQFLQLIGEIV